LIEIVNGRKIGAWMGRHVVTANYATLPLMDIADGRMVQTGQIRQFPSVPKRKAAFLAAAGRGEQASGPRNRQQGARGKA
jgi:hypothetical protein